MQKVPLQLSVRLALVFASICTVFLMIAGSAGAESPSTPQAEYVVASGDTLWAIAARYSDPGADVRRMVSDIRALNGSDETILPGQVLVIPAR